MESPRYNTMLAMQLTSLLRGFVYAYFFRVKMVGTERVELSLIQGMSLCNTNIACVPIEMVTEAGFSPLMRV
jgi:phosphosulfolactate synthase (CoM biosynthesis protein A)